MTNAQTVPALVLTRTYGVPRERVFAAWTTPGILERFFSPGSMKKTEAHVDPRLGGGFRILMTTGEGESFNARGTYLEFAAPERLVMTWRWEEDEPAEEYDSLLMLEFHDRGGETEFVLTHEKLLSAESSERHAGGWTDVMNALSTVLGA